MTKAHSPLKRTRIINLFLYLIFIATQNISAKNTLIALDSLPAIVTTVITTSPICLYNATNPFNGQFSQVLKIKSQSNKTWVVFEAINFYAGTSLNPPVPPTLLLDGTILDELSISTEISEFSILGIFESNTNFIVTLKSNDDEYIRIYGGGDTYSQISINGDNSVCISETETYNVPSDIFGYGVNTINGTIINANVDSSNSVMGFKYWLGFNNIYIK